jgi:2',3'-cyclic-nucleotide 2'-phosphodiesterase (5'-nucleotidase family)
MRAHGMMALFLCAWLVVLCHGLTTPGAAQPAIVTLSVVSTNDVHGRLAQLPLLGGYVHNLRAARERDGGAVLLLDAGDIFQGTLESNSTEGAAMIRGYAALGYSAAAIGNHEFDFGPLGPHSIPASPREDSLGALKARVRQAPFPMLCANLRARDGGPARIAGLRASSMLRIAGLRVGIVGGLTRDALSSTHAANTQNLRVTALPQAIAQEAGALRQAGARVVIAVVHAGGDCRQANNPDDLSSCDAAAEVFELARALPTGLVDLIVAGHTHAQLAHRVHGIPIVEAYANGRAFGRADLRVPKDPTAPITHQLYPPHALCEDALDRPVCATEDYEGLAVTRAQPVLTAIAADLAHAKAERDRPLGVVVSAAVTRASKVESALNNLVADLMLQASPGADAAFNNAGGVRISLPVGPLSYGTLYEMFPFDNTFATLHVSASELAEIVGHNLAADGGIISLAGLRADAHCVAERLVVELSTADGRAVPPEQALTVVTSDFVATQGDGMLRGMSLGPGRVQIASERSIRAALVDGLRAYPGGTLDGSDKRLYDPKRPRIRFPGARPVVCTTQAAP